MTMERSVRDPWAVLGLAETSDESAIRKAYAALVRQYRPDSHPQEFARVRESYELAMARARDLRWHEAQQPGRDEGEEEGEEAAARTEGAEAAPNTANDDFQTSTPVVVEVPGEKILTVVRPADDTQAPGAAPLEEALELEHFDAQAAVDELARTHNDHGEGAAVEMFHSHLARCANATIDARLDYEWVVLRSLLTSDMPPLGLVFEGDRQFRWSERFGDVERIFGEGGARRIAFLAESAATWVYLREYSPNPWQRRLFGAPRGRLPWFGAASLMVGARGTARSWRRRAEEGQLPSLLLRLDESVERAIGWKAVMSADLALGLLLVSLVLLPVAMDTGWDGLSWTFALLCVGTVGLAVGLAVAARWFVRWPRVAPYAVPGYWNHGWRQWACVGAVVGLIAVGFLGITSEGPPIVRHGGLAAFGVLLALLVATIFWGLWKASLAVEAALIKPVFQPMVTSSVLAFRRMREDAQSGWASPTRTTLARLKALPQAVRDHRAEVKSRRADAKARGVVRKPAKFNWWWLLWILIVVGNALMRIK